MNAPRLIRLPELTQHLGIGKTKLYAMIKTGEFPAPVKIGKVSAWKSTVVERWVDSLHKS